MEQGYGRSASNSEDAEVLMAAIVRPTRFLRVDGVTHAMAWLSGSWVSWCYAHVRAPRAFPWTHPGPASCLFCIEVGVFVDPKADEDTWQFNPTGHRPRGAMSYGARRQLSKSFGSTRFLRGDGSWIGPPPGRRRRFDDDADRDDPWTKPLPFQRLRHHLSMYFFDTPAFGHPVAW